jgi:DNA segregation ATPase FtsK/SpoIIIE-like protein
MSDNIMNSLQTCGINPFAVVLLAESALKSPFVERMATEPLEFFFPISRSDCAGWAGVRLYVQPVAAEGKDAPWRTRNKEEIERVMTKEQMVQEILRLDALVGRQVNQLQVARLPLLAPEYPLDADLDPMYGDAVEVVKRTGKPSISLVQRHLKISYNRADRLLERMEKEQLVSPMGENGIRTILEGGAA